MTTIDAGSERRPSTSLLMANLSGGHVAMTVILPSMPALAIAFSSDKVTVQLTLTLYLAGFAAIQLVAGPLSDQYGRRPVLLGGLALFAVAGVACALAPSLEALMAARFLQGAGACVGMVVSRAIIRDYYDETNTARILGFGAMATGLAPLFAPIIGGYIEVWSGWRAVFWFATAYAIVVLAAAWYMQRETHTPSAAGGRSVLSPLHSYGELIRSGPFLAYVAAGGFSMAGFFTYLASVPYVFIGLLGMTPDVFGWVNTSYLVFYILGSFLTTRLTTTVGVPRLVAWGSGLVLGASALFTGLVLFGFSDVITIVASVCATAIFHGLIFPSALAGAVSARPDIAGAGAALAGFIQIAFGAAISSLMGVFVYDSALPVAATMLVLSILGLAAAGIVYHNHRSA